MLGCIPVAKTNQIVANFFLNAAYSIFTLNW